MAVWLIHPEGHVERPVPRRPTAPAVGLELALVRAFASLTPREREIVQAAARGQSNSQIAAETWLSPSTVETHVRSAMRKLDMSDRAQLVGCASRAGLLG